MKKKFNDLTIEEFVRVICNVPKRYEISMKSYSKENGCIELDILMGDYEMLHETFLKLANEGNCIGQKGLDLLKNDFFDYNLEFSLTDIYNYLDNNTKGFEKKRCRILLDDMNYYKSLIIEELEKDGNEYEGQFFFYSKAVILLIEQVGDLIDNSPKIADEVKLTVSDCNKLPKELNTKEAENLFAQISYCEKDGNLYKWNGTPSLFGHFVEMTSDALNIRPSNGRIPWSIYKQAFQMSEKSITTAKGKINRNRNMHEAESDGFDEIKKACKC